jgi:diaminopimelate decarboxylase
LTAQSLLPDTASVGDGGVVSVGGVAVTELAEEFGTPLVVYCEETMLARARSYVEAAPDALVLYSVKAFPSVLLLRLLGETGLGADVSTLGELAFARAAGIPGERLIVHGNNKSDDELGEAAEADAAFVVLDAPDELERALEAGVRRFLVRVTPGIDAETHDAIKTGHYGSKFGLPPEQARGLLRRAQELGAEVAGLHVHIGSQLLETGGARMTIDWLAAFAASCRAELGWTPDVIDLGGGLGIQYVPDEPAPAPTEFVRTLLAELDRAWKLHDLPRPQVVLEPGRSVVGPAGLTLYRVGVVKRASETTTYVAVDGGMSDNPRPLLYGARYTALLANRASEDPTGMYAVCGKHCESGDVLIDRVALPEPRRGDLLAIPATGAYTLGMGSNYNAVPRPAAVIVRDGQARLLRRRETLDDLLRLEAG